MTGAADACWPSLALVGGYLQRARTILEPLFGGEHAAHDDFAGRDHRVVGRAGRHRCWPTSSTWSSPGLADGAVSRAFGARVPAGLQQVLRGRALRRHSSFTPLRDGSRTVLWRGVDAGVIDGIVNGVGLARTRASAAVCACCSPATSAATRPGWCSGSVVIVAVGELPGRRRMNLLDILLLLAAGRLPVGTLFLPKDNHELIRMFALVRLAR